MVSGCEYLRFCAGCGSGSVSENESIIAVLKELEVEHPRLQTSCRYSFVCSALSLFATDPCARDDVVQQSASG